MCIGSGDWLPEEAPSKTKATDGWIKLRPKMLSRQILEAVWLREERVRKSKAVTRYLADKYFEHRLTEVRVGCCPRLAVGMTYIAQCRVGGVWTIARMARFELIDEQHKKKCPCCHQRRAEDVAPLVLECSHWMETRTPFIGELVASAKTLHSGASSSRRNIWVTLLLGGESQGARLEDWDFDPSFQAPEAPSGADGRPSPEDESEDDGTILWPTSLRVQKFGCLWMASFLAWVKCARAPIIRVLDSRQDLPNAEDRRPNG